LTGRGALIALLILLLDQASKLYLIYVFHLGDRGHVSVAPFVDFVLTWNAGISYGLLQQDTVLGRWLLLGFTCGAVLLLWVWLARAPSRLTALALGLIIGGAVGNAIDRFAYGAVADFVFLHATFGTWEFRWFIFNLADVAIVAGVALLLYESVFPGAAVKAP
jgi:signal peptidase II